MKIGAVYYFSSRSFIFLNKRMSKKIRKLKKLAHAYLGGKKKIRLIVECDISWRVNEKTRKKKVRRLRRNNAFVTKPKTFNSHHLSFGIFWHSINSAAALIDFNPIYCCRYTQLAGVRKINSGHQI